MRALAPLSSAGLLLLGLAASGCKGGCDQAGAESSGGALSAPSPARFGGSSSCPGGNCSVAAGNVAPAPADRGQTPPQDRPGLPAFGDRRVADVSGQTAPQTVEGRPVGQPPPQGATALQGPPPPAHSGVKELSTQAEFDKAQRTGTPMLVDWYGQSCPPCRRLQGPYAEAARVLDGQVAFYKVDAHAPGAPQPPRGGGLPVLAFYENGALVSARNGLPPGVQMSGLKDWLVGALADKRLE